MIHVMYELTLLTQNYFKFYAADLPVRRKSKFLTFAAHKKHFGNVSKFPKRLSQFQIIS